MTIDDFSHASHGATATAKLMLRLLPPCLLIHKAYDAAATLRLSPRMLLCRLMIATAAIRFDTPPIAAAPIFRYVVAAVTPRYFRRRRHISVCLFFMLPLILRSRFVL